MLGALFTVHLAAGFFPAQRLRVRAHTAGGERGAGSAGLRTAGRGQPAGTP
jgi:hypothetical protein